MRTCSLLLLLEPSQKLLALPSSLFYESILIHLILFELGNDFLRKLLVLLIMACAVTAEYSRY